MAKRIYDITRYNRYDVLKPGPVFWLCLLFLCRHTLALAFIGLAKSGIGAKGGGNPQAIDVSSLFALVEPALLFSDIPALILLYVVGARVPTATRVTRWLWSRGREMFLLSAALYLAILAYLHDGDVGRVDAVGWTLVGLDVAFAAFVLASPFLRDLFADFPQPETKDDPVPAARDPEPVPEPEPAPAPEPAPEPAPGAEPRPAPSAGTITVVVYHADIAGETAPELQPVLDPASGGRADYVALVDACYASARHHMPDCRFVFLTDRTTAVPESREALWEVHRFDRPDGRIMIHRIAAYAAFLEQCDGPGRFLFCDSDVLVNRPLAPLFQPFFHIGLTFRIDPAMPFNAGVILARGQPDFAARFFRALAAQIEAGNPKQHYWYGDQTAMVDLLVTDPDLAKLGDTIRWNDLTVRLVPADSANYAPDDGERPDDPALAERYLLHFKGARKARIRDFVAAL